MKQQSEVLLGLLSLTLALLCRLLICRCESQKGWLVSACISECVLPGRHVACLLVVITFMWPVTNRCVSFVHVCITEPVRVYISVQESSSTPRFWKVTLSWLLVCVLLYPLHRPLTEKMSVGLLSPCRHACYICSCVRNSVTCKRKGKFYGGYCLSLTTLEASCAFINITFKRNNQWLVMEIYRNVYMIT